MNPEILKGKWNELKGAIKMKWGDLTDDDLKKVEGQEDKFVGLLQKKYGYSKDKAQKEYRDFISGWK